MSKRKILQVHPDDNVLEAHVNHAKGETRTYKGINYILQEDIGEKHK